MQTDKPEQLDSGCWSTFILGAVLVVLLFLATVVAYVIGLCL